MKIRLSHTDIPELALEQSYAQCFSDPIAGTMERSYSGDLFFADGLYKEILFENTHIGFGNFRTHQAVHLDVDADIESVEMHFALCGQVFTHEKEFRKNLSFDCNQHNIIYANEFKGQMEWGPNSTLQFFEINLSPAFFKRYLSDEFQLFRIFQEAMEQKHFSNLTKKNLQITQQMHEIIREIIECQRGGSFKRMFLEAKVIELLMLQLEQMSAWNDLPSPEFKKADVEKIYAARDIIHNNLNTSWTLFNLATQVGTNEFTLKKGFKKIFGTSVIAYWQHLKMEQARQLLHEKEVSIAELSEWAGYKNPQHFTTAFKKKFGITPSQFRK